MLVISGDVYVTMQSTSLTRKCPATGTQVWVASLTLDCNGVFAIKSYAGRVFFQGTHKVRDDLQLSHFVG